MKIGHISDLHWLDLSGARIRDFFNKRLTGGFNLVAGRAKKHTKQAVIDALDAMRAAGVDHLVVTGDLSRKQADRLHALAQGLYDRVLEKLEDSDVEACLDCKD